MSDPPHLGTDPTPQETEEYCTFWKTRGEKVAEIMRWRGCAAFDPDFLFRVDEHRSEARAVRLPARKK